jgi:integrase
MGTIFQPYVSRPMPDGARIVTRKGKRFAMWTDAKGRAHKAPATGPTAKRPGIVERSLTYWAQYRDADGRKRRVSTGCRDKAAALQVLADLVRRAEMIRGGIVTASEAQVGDHADTPIQEHIEAYVAALAVKRGKGARRTVAPEHVASVRHSLQLVVESCGWMRLRDLDRNAVERWVARQLDGKVPPAPRTVNAKLAAVVAWGNWLVTAGRLATNPFARIRKLDEADDVRRQRRALTGEEMKRLLTVARLRPVAEFGRQTLRVVDEDLPRDSRATWKRAALTFDDLEAAAERGRGRLRPDVLARLERAGRERALLYAVLVTTGLRKGELAAITVADVRLDDPQPVIVLPGADAKSGQRATIPLRPDVAAELGAWLNEKTQSDAGWRAGVIGSTSTGTAEPLFCVPTGLIRILDRDMAAAGIPKRDDRGRTVDVHALRHTFASHLVAAGVAPRIAQAALRHSTLDLTMQHYTDPRLLDVAGALAALPALPAVNTLPNEARATGTDDRINVAPNVAPAPAELGRKRSFPDGIANAKRGGDSTRISRKTLIEPAKREKRAKGLEPSTSSLGS